MPAPPIAPRVALALAVVALAACRPEPLPDLGAVPDFVLTERGGTPTSRDDLRGRPWVASFIFTRCPDVCPALTTRVAALARSHGGAARFVSISVDPTHDTPAVLADYAARFGAGPDWRFLTGPRDAIATLLRDGFHVAFADDGPATAPITHSDRLVLVDAELRIRGYYRGLEPEDVERLDRDLRRLTGR